MTISPEDLVPQRDKNAFACPRCSVYANQEWFPLYIRQEYWDSEPEFSLAHEGGFRQAGVPTLEPGEASQAKVAAAVIGGMLSNISNRRYEGEWAMALCSACNDYSVWRSDDLMYPRSSNVAPPSTDMPDDAKALYEEARTVMAVSRRAGAALARATLERLLKELDTSQVPKASLATRIDAILPSVSTSLGEMLTVIRHIGNKSLHVESQPDDAVMLILDEEQTELVGLIFGAINELVDEKITKPKITAGYLAAVPERVRNEVKNLGNGK